MSRQKFTSARIIDIFIFYVLTFSRYVCFYYFYYKYFVLEISLGILSQFYTSIVIFMSQFCGHLPDTYNLHYVFTLTLKVKSPREACRGRFGKRTRGVLNNLKVEAF